MALPATIRVNVGAPFPAQVAGAGGIFVSKANGVWTVEPDFGALALITPASVTDPSTKQVWVFDPVTGIYNTMTLAGLGDALYKLTSTTSLAIAAGSPVFVTQPNKDVGVGSWLIAISGANPANFMVGQVTAYDGSGNLTLAVPSNGVGGTGTHADWTLRASAPPGPTGPVGPTGASSPSPPQGRLTLTSGVAVPTTDVAAATTVYYTPTVGRYVPLWNGATIAMTDTGGELSQATTDTTKSPAAVAANSNYDIFVWSDGGTMRATRGPAWTSDTARGTGAGTTELDFTTAQGIPLNKNAITNGPAAGRGTYVGTIRSNGTSTIDFGFGTAAAGGGTANLNVWNLYNQVTMRAYVSDSTASWTYAANTVRALNASSGNRVNFVSGLAQQVISANLSVHVVFAAAAGAFYAPGIGLDSITAYNFLGQFTNAAATANVKMVPPVFGTYAPQLGFHFIQALEFGDGTNTSTLDQSRVGNGAGLQVTMAM